jgi:2-amino-4-hydroxy-6-hydroxymethyldihydropteridine diphosphokinase
VNGPVLIGAGANVGDAITTLAAAVDVLADLDGLTVEDVSAVYRTAPWPPPGDPGHVPQDDFLNLVVRASTDLDPEALLDELLAVEAAFGRDRTREVRWGPRVLDLDLLMVGDAVMTTGRLTLPHPRLAERAFVLVPALEVLPGGSLPDGRRLTALLAALAPVEGIELEVRLDAGADGHPVRPAGPVGPAATFRRPAVDDLAREHGA